MGDLRSSHGISSMFLYHRSERDPHLRWVDDGSDWVFLVKNYEMYGSLLDKHLVRSWIVDVLAYCELLLRWRWYRGYSTRLHQWGGVYWRSWQRGVEFFHSQVRRWRAQDHRSSLQLLADGYSEMRGYLRVFAYFELYTKRGIIHQEAKNIIDKNTILIIFILWINLSLLS